MGSPEGEAGREAEREAQVEVELSRGFWLGKYEVTQAEYEKSDGRRTRRTFKESGGRAPGGTGELGGSDGLLREADRSGAQGGQAARGLGLHPAERGAVGIRLPGGGKGPVFRREAGRGGVVQGQQRPQDPSGG